MRIVRTCGAVVVWLVATVLLVLAAVLSVTIVLLPVGALLAFASFRLYKLGMSWVLPRPADVRRAARKQGRRWRRRLVPRSSRRSRPWWRGGRRRRRGRLRWR